MDSQHRHELEQNDLADFITNFREWWIKHGLKTLLLVLVLLLVVFYVKMSNARAREKRDQMWMELADATSPDILKQLSEAHNETPGYRELAHLRAADLALGRVIGSDNPMAMYGIKSDQPALTEQQKADMLAGAEQNYQAVIDATDAAHNLYRYNAMLGLACIEENRQKWDAAAKLYNDVIGETKSDVAGYQSIFDTATARLAALDRAKDPVQFAPEPPPPATQPAASEPASQPAAATPAATPDATKPAASPETKNGS